MLNEHAGIDRRPPLTQAAHDDLAVTISDMAERALLDELFTWPKPGLVSHVDCGSHRDMDADTFRRSVAAIKPFLTRMVAEDAELVALRCIGLDAEAAMLSATAGVNTHRGAIFALGLLCAAARAHQGRGTIEDLVAVVRERWGAAILSERPPPVSHGAAAMARYGVRGARGEAALGFPTATRIGLPALRRGRCLAPDDAEAARVECIFALIATVEDTNLLHRAGPEGLAFARGAAQSFLATGGVAQDRWRDRAAAVHGAFVARGLSPGGSADLLAVTLFLDAYVAQ